MEYQFSNMDTKHIQTVLKKLTHRQSEILRQAEIEARDITDSEAKEFDSIDLQVKTGELELDTRELKKSKRKVPIYGGDTPAIRPHGKIGARWADLYPESRGSHMDSDDYLKELIEKRTMVTTSGPAGGYDVPVQLWASIFDSALSQSAAFQYCRTYPMESMTLVLPAWDSETRTDGEIAGVTADWKAEGDSFTARTPKMRSMTLKAHKSGIYVDVSHECLADAQSLSSALQPLMSRAVAAAFDIKILRGDGVVGPQGVLNSPCKISVARNTANAVEYADLAGMVGRLMPNASPRWFINPDVLAQLLQLVDDAGNYIWIPNTVMGAAAAIPQMLLGFPVTVTDYASALGSEGDVILADLGYYALALREGVRFESTIAAQWSSDLVSFRCIMRGNGQGLLANEVTPMFGTNTLSPFVVLE